MSEWVSDRTQNVIDLPAYLPEWVTETQKMSKIYLPTQVSEWAIEVTEH